MMNDQIKAIYELSCQSNRLIIWLIVQRGIITYALHVTPVSAQAAKAPPKKAIHFPSFMEAWRDGCYMLDHPATRRKAA